MSRMRQMNEKGWDRAICFITIVIVVFLVVAGILMDAFGINPARITDVNDYVTSYVVRTDGTSEKGNKTSYPTTQKGDKAVLLVSDIPALEDGEAAALCFHEWNMSVVAYYHDKQIYSNLEKTTQTKNIIGHRYIVVPVPADYEGDNIRIELTNTQSSGESYVDMWMCSMSGAYKSMLSGHEISFSGLIAIIFVSVLVVLMMFLMGIISRKINPLIFLMLFLVLISCWNFGSCGFLYIMTDSILLSSLVEYAAIFLAPIPLSIYMYIKLRCKFPKIVLAICTIWFSALSVTTFVSWYMEMQVNYGMLLMSLHLSIMFMLMFYIISLIVEMLKHKHHDMQLADWGFMICMIIAFLEFFRRDYVNYITADVLILRESLSVYAIAVLAVSNIASIASMYAKEFTEQMQKAQLEKMAYSDQLTGIPNRSGCYKKMDEMINEGRVDYTMIFMDLNYLKKANDQYGHETGDALLKNVATVISKVFSNVGFYGRWGGDEFIACVPGDPEVANEIVARLNQAIRQANEENELPVELSVAVGCIYSSSDEPLMPADAVSLADHQMYLRKKQMKNETIA